MKHLLIIPLLAAALLGCKSEPNTVCTIYGKASNCDDKELYVTLDDQKDTIRINEDGTFSKEFAVTRPTDGILQCNKSYLNLYLEPSKTLEISFGGKAGDSTVIFGGKLSLPNEYLLEKKRAGLDWARLPKLAKPQYQPADLKQARDSLSQVEIALLDNFKADHRGLSKGFYKREKKVLEYSAYYDLYYYYPNWIEPKNKARIVPTDDWYSFLDQVDFNDPKLLQISIGREFFTLYVGKETLKRGNIPNEYTLGNPDWLRDEFALVKEKFTHPEFYDVIMHYYLTDYMEDDGMGTAGIEDLVAEYLSKATNLKTKKSIQRLCDKWAPIASDQPAPAFTLPDNKGNKVSLSDFRGKYVFIEFWATWCIPCKGDIPYLKQIIDNYRDRNIVFISMSVDKDKSAWEKMLREGYIEEDKLILFDEKPNWIHLNDPQTIKANHKYLVTSIPKYTLINPEGNIVNGRCPRPWRPELRTLLDAQPGL